MLFDGTDPLLQTLDSFLNLPVGELDKCAGFPELLVQIRSIIGVTPVEMHLKPLGNELQFMPKSLGQHTGVALGIDNFSPKSFCSSADNLLNLRQRFLVHAVSPYKVVNFMALEEGSQTALCARQRARSEYARSTAAVRTSQATLLSFPRFG